MTMTTPAPTARARQFTYNDPAQANLGWYRAGLWVEHCTREVAAVVTAFLAFVWLWTGWAATETGAYAAAALTVAPTAWWLTGPRSRERRSARKIEDRWATACARYGLYTRGRLGNTRIADLTNIRHDRGNITADGELPPGLPFSALAANRHLLEATYARGRQRSLELHGDDHHRTFRLTITRWVAFDAATADPFPYQPGRGVAITETGEPLDLPCPGPHALIVGQSGAGKSSWVNAILAEATHNPHHPAIWGIDLKKVELTPWAPTLHRLATTPDQANRMLHDLGLELEHRFAAMAAHQAREWRPGLGFPPLLVVIDELRELVRRWPGEEPDAPRERLARLEAAGSLARAAGVQLVVATQEPLADTIGRLRTNLPITICGWVRSESDAVTALGPGLAAQLRPQTIALQGVAWVVGKGRDPVKARAVWLDDRDVARIVGG